MQQTLQQAVQRDIALHERDITLHAGVGWWGFIHISTANHIFFLPQLH
jgi:hypothetical protein